jgi:drug/metabolite transporter (DMT)-like permease
VVLYYYAVFAFFTLFAILLAESWVNQEPLRLLTYSWRQLATMVGVNFLNTGGLVFNTIALQNEKSGYIQLFGYVSVLYAFLGDILIFGYVFSTQELAGAFLILCVILFLVAK